MSKSKPVRTLKIGHGNGHNEQSLVELVRESKCASFGCNEANRLLPALRQLEGYDVYVGGDSRAPGEVPIVVKSRLRMLGHSAHQISDEIPRLSRVAPDRWTTQVRYRHPLATELGFRGIAHINWHPDAGPEQLHGKDPDAPIVREYIKARDAIKADVRHARTQGFLAVVTGDLQMDANDTQPWSPRRTYASLGLHTHASRIDWIAFDPAIKIKVVKTPALFDHNAIIATFVAA